MKVSRERLIGGVGGVEVEGVRSIYINLLTQSKALVYYIKSLFLPTELSVEHYVEAASGLGDSGVIASLLIVLIVVAVAVVIVRKRALITFGVLWFFVVLLPETILPLNLIINEHRVYLSGVGFVLIAGSVYQAFSVREKYRVLLGVGVYSNNDEWVWYDKEE